MAMQDTEALRDPVEADDGALDAAESNEATESSEASEPNDASEAVEDRTQSERSRIEEQLALLEKKQAELRRALAIADHPELGDAIREIEGRAYGLSRAEQRLAEPRTKGEERQRAKLEKKLEATKQKRDELDRAIAAIETELAALSEERVTALRADRETALQALFVVLARHADAFESAGVQVTVLVPELEAWLPELRAMADARTSIEA